MEPKTQDNSETTNKGIEEKYGDRDYPDQDHTTNDKHAYNSQNEETNNGWARKADNVNRSQEG